NSGTINQTNYSITLYNNGSSTSGYEGGLVNLAGGIINLSTSACISGGYSFEYLINQGTINVSTPSSTSTVNVDYFTNSAILSAQHGTLQVEGAHLALLSSETLSVGLNSATDFGSITYNNSAALNLAQAGTFQVMLNGGYVPVVGSSFKVLSANSLGTFSGIFANFSSPSGAIWKTNYTATSLILTNVGQITWTTPASITYGTALGGSQLNASTTPSVAGAFTYNPVAGTVLNSGAGQLLATTFTPSVIGDAPASFQVPITVLKAPLGVTANNQTKTYGQNFTFAGTEFVPTGLVNGDTVTSTTLASAGAISNAPVSGSPYVITITNALGDAGLTNYIITYTNGALTVNPAPLGITANNRIKTYGQNIVFTGTEFVPTGLQNLETVGTVTLTSAGAISNAPVSGSPYSIAPSAATGGTFTPGNYAIIYTNGTLTVNRAGLTVTANNAARNYGVANPAFSASYGGFVNNENASVVSGVPGFSTPATVASAVGGYAITPLLGTLSAANYSFGPFNPGTLTVNPAALSITASNQSKIYGQKFVFTGTEFATSGLVNGDSVASASLASAGAISNAPVSGSPYAITITNALGDAGLTNYTISYINGALTVNRAGLTVTANNAARNYGVANPAFSASYGGFVNNENAGVISGVPGFSTPATVTSAVGRYAITPLLGTLSAANYSFGPFNPGTLTINPAALSITASNQSKTYGQTFTFAGTEFATSGLVNGDSVASASLASTGAISNAPVSGSPYAITITNALGDAGLTNYTISYFNGALTLNKATLTITADSTNKIVGETLTFAGTEFTASGLQNSETVGSVTLTSPGAPAGATAATYNIVPSAPVGGSFSQGNYTDIFVDGTLTVYGQPELFLTTIGNQYVLTFQTVPGQMYQLESETNLVTAGWASLGGVIPGTGGIVNVTNTIPVPPLSESFFRLQIAP
ncbi:MAG: MBG domain-containing protein, partial [Verrucomicrobiia bacterium]